MKADTVGLAAVFGSQVRYMVPLFQRPYVWTREDQWEPLWQDVQAVADRQLDDAPSNDRIPHFLGAIVLEQTLVPTGRVVPRSVVDGQQRLTTLQLLLAAARSVAEEYELDDARRTFEKLLVNESFLVNDDYLYKVLPTERDRAAFREAMADGVAAATGKHRIHEAFRFFRESVHAWVSDGADVDIIERRVEALSTVLWDLLVMVTIDLEPGDNAQIIFETLNARGTPLLAGDLIKNHIFQVASLQGADIGKLYAEQWAVLDSDWWREEVRRGRLRQPRLDAFLNHWLAMRTGNEVVSHDLFPSFKRYLADGQKQAEGVLEDLARYAHVYESFEKEPATTDLGRFLYRLSVMEVTTVYPALLWLLGPEGLPDQSERQSAIRAIESWLIRRLLTRMTTKNYNVVFLALLNVVRSKALAESAKAQHVIEFLAGLSGESQVWPTDAAIRSTLRSLPLYAALPRSRTRMVLEALEEASHSGLSEKVILPHDLTVEHVLPQEWAAHWPLPDTDDPSAARDRRDLLKHTLGNLTLVTGRLNPKLSNGAWPEKRAALNQYSVLLISADIRQSETWDETAIVARTERLTDKALAVWQRPPTPAVVDLPETESSSAAGQEVSSAQPARGSTVGPLPDEQQFAAVLERAEEAGIGGELRRIIGETRDLGLYPRPFRRSVMISPPTDKRAYLFTVWPQHAEGGSFRFWPSVEAFVQYFPAIDPADARAELGDLDGPRTLRRGDVGRLLASVRRLLDADTGRLGGPPEDRSDLPVEGDGLPSEIAWLIAMRSTAQGARISRRFAREALRFDGVKLRLQGGKGEPSYFQVRHPRFPQVVAYSHVRPDGLGIDYRLPQSAETYGVAQARDNFYGISLRVRNADDLGVALQLLEDALDRSD